MSNWTSRNIYFDHYEDDTEPPTDAVLKAREPICQRLAKRGWFMWLDTSYCTVYIKRGWFCRVPYTETIKPTFGRMTKKVTA